MVIAHHLIWTAYGWWLPNDPRGSGSQIVRNDVLKHLGTLHLGRKSTQPRSCDVRDFYIKAAQVLTYPLLNFGPEQIAAIGEAFASVLRTCRYTCYACAIMPDHVHLLIRKHKHLAEEMMGNFQRTGRLAIAGRFGWEMDHPVFAVGGWKVFLDTTEDIWRTIRYIEENPEKGGLPMQRWRFVTAYNNWPLHEGHSENSPYARRLRQRG